MNTSSWLIIVIGHTLIAIDRLTISTIVIGSCVTFKCSFIVYCLIIYYWWARGKHLTLNLNMINNDIVPNIVNN